MGTQGKLPVALKCLDNWGFKYHCLFTWDKLNGISINGFQRRTELVLYGYKGVWVLIEKKVIIYPLCLVKRQPINSAKPRIFYAFLRERTLEPRIDIFARKRHYGFDAYGNQVETQIEIPLFITQQSKREKP
jgi:N6-adenosine-specific RNA methylase IME4